MASNKTTIHTIFISSTFNDLKEERRHLINAIIQKGDFPISMENFSSSSDDTSEAIKRYIDNSNFFVLLIGDKYGSINKAENKSFTELEYEYAISIGLKPLVFIKRSTQREEREKEFVERIEAENHCLWKEYDNAVELVSSVINSINNEAENNKNLCWVKKHDSIKICNYVGEYNDFVLEEESRCSELIALPKRLNTIFKPVEMLEEIANKRYGSGGDLESRDKYVNGHKKRYQMFIDFLSSGKKYYELHNKKSLIEYVSGLHHNGIEHLNHKYLLQMLDKWKEAIRKFPENYFVRIVDDVIPFKYEIFDRKCVSMHETIGKSVRGRVCAFVIRDEETVESMYSDFKTIWSHSNVQDSSPEKICEWIDNNLATIIKQKMLLEEFGEETQITDYNLDLESTLNTRDIGGKVITDGKGRRVKMQKLVRSDFGSSINTIDLIMMHEYGITKILNLSHEYLSDQDTLNMIKSLGMEYKTVAYSNEFISSIMDAYKSSLTDDSVWEALFITILENQKDWIRDVFNEIANNNSGCTFLCCKKGRDRTGLIVILLYLFLSVDYNSILLDYGISDFNLVNSNLVSDELLQSSSFYEKKRIVDSVINHINTKYSQVAAYLLSCGLKFDALQKLQEIFILQK